MKIQFLGAAGTVTGSRYLISSGPSKVLVDCGLFQGLKALRLKNREPFPIPPSELSAVLLTHAHLDHSGYIPLLVKNGFRGPIYCTSATKDLCSLLLPDSGYLQEEEAEFANRKGFSKHHPALPLYTEKEAEFSLQFLKPVPWAQRQTIPGLAGQNLQFEFHPAGHLFGAASIVIFSEGQSIAFSGDIGRKIDPLNRLPNFRQGANTLVVESTYGDRKHASQNTEDQLAEIILKTFQRQGTLVIPSFAVGRAQLVLYYIHCLRAAGKIPEIPIYLNSPMAIKANDIFCRHFKESKMTLAQATAICALAKPISSVEESIALNMRKDPMIIIAASGMATGGRVLHHLKAFAPDPKNTILFVGFQALGTRGDSMLKGSKEVKIHGEWWPVRAEVAEISSMSAHADGDEVFEWIKDFQQLPSTVYVTHGEPAAAAFFRDRLIRELKIEAILPSLGEEVILEPSKS